MTKIEKEVFGSYQGKDVLQYSLTNRSGTRISVLNYAGILREFSVIDDQKRVQLLLRSDRLADYTDNSMYLNHIIARTAGRIKDARFELNGKEIELPANENGNSLHGGPHSFAKSFFDIKADSDKNRIILEKTLSTADDGFPGSLKLKIIYQLDENDLLSVSFIGQQSESDGVFNPTLHTYFNLADQGNDDVTDHQLWIDSDKHLEVDQGKNPTGKLLANQGPFDLKNQPDLGQALFQLKKTIPEGGFDDVFFLKGHSPAAVLKDKISGRKVEISSLRNALVVYTSNGLDNGIELNHGSSHPWIGVALEAQTAPNSENQPSLGNVSIKKDQVITRKIEYLYSKDA